MNINKLSLPHPVLGIGDDVSGKYYPVCNKEIFVDRVILWVEHKLENSSLGEMINQGKAVYGVEINCAQTVYREMFLSEKDAQEIIIDSNLLRDKVTVNFFILAKGKNQKYQPSSANEEYEGEIFDLTEGEVLGYGGSTFFYADKIWKESEAVGSFMCITKSDIKEGPIEYDLMSDCINICLPETDYFNYKNSWSDYKKIYNVFHGALVYPALVYALIRIFNTGEDDDILKKYKWYEHLSDRLEANSGLKKIPRTFENAPLIAQTLLSNKDEGMPMARTLSCIKEIIDATYKINE